MSTHLSVSLEPAVLLYGSVAEADSFLAAALWHSDSCDVSVEYVQHWASLMRGRGIEFASHASACQYWLYEKQSVRIRPALKATGEPRKIAG
jgi:hypothetical protein